MPLQNRMTPLGEPVAHPARGLLYGNRGVLHAADGRIRRRYGGRRWIACRLEFRGWRRDPRNHPGRFTALFFLDEATALAAGHRPCALCRHAEYVRFAELWGELHPGELRADAIDRRLHVERVDAATGGARPHESELATLPDGAMILHRGRPGLVLAGELLAWTHAGYAGREPRPRRATVEVLTPPSLVGVLQHGFEPLLHPTAEAGTRRAE